MTVYIVESHCGDSHRIAGVYASEEKANEFVAYQKEHGYDCDVTEYEVEE